MEVALKLLGILFGVLARTLVPYLRKVNPVRKDGAFTPPFLQGIKFLSILSSPL